MSSSTLVDDSIFRDGFEQARNTPQMARAPGLFHGRTGVHGMTNPTAGPSGVNIGRAEDDAARRMDDTRPAASRALFQGAGMAVTGLAPGRREAQARRRLLGGG